jgi:hypothetical protein
LVGALAPTGERINTFDLKAEKKNAKATKPSKLKLNGLGNIGELQSKLDGERRMLKSCAKIVFSIRSVHPSSGSKIRSEHVYIYIYIYMGAGV